ncbi:MAG: hypothetical protein CVU57_14985 [Deltaproteobacteria bacterium HGW-Deltaproteobacteria-15]|jgi:CelD/BcsL family acetyltransferase involved in cellulose biosynthesis/GNAT superfamily N-acetyltransferase|nr:MAG: hypothetical protein CVU57_14985 [Deltaproteobacteria bacterium HGW-Deltaproteobacteria-15]
MSTETFESSSASVVVGNSALSLLDSTRFVAQWKNLMESCPWATVFQSPSFCIPWFRVYAERYEPVLVIQRREGALEGLLVLAIERKKNILVHAGDRHAEYQVWICRLADAEIFPCAAFAALRQTYRKGMLRLIYTAPGTPLDWALRANNGSIRTDVRFHKRGLMRLGEGSKIESSLRKRGNKSRLARLKRIGPISFSQLRAVADLDAAMDEIVVQCDVRHGGMHQLLPFSEDPLRRRMYLEWMSEPELVHATALRVGSKLVASHVSLINGRDIPLGLFTHAPELGAHSPGKLLILFLGRLLGEHGYEHLDLTPGDDSYKNRFADDFDQVAVLDIFFERLAYARSRVRRSALSFAKRIANHRSRQVAQAAKTLGLIRRQGQAPPSQLLLKNVTVAIRRGRSWTRSDQEFRIYLLERPITQSQAAASLRVNCLADTLQYHPCSLSSPSLTEFLRCVLTRLESGQILFTALRPGLLLHYSWLIPRATRAGWEYGHDIQLPFEAAVLWDEYTHPSARGQGFHTASLLARTTYAFNSGPAKRAVIVVGSDNTTCRQHIEEVGFKHIGSARLTCRWGSKTCSMTWVDPVAQGAAGSIPGYAATETIGKGGLQKTLYQRDLT